MGMAIFALAGPVVARVAIHAARVTQDRRNRFEQTAIGFGRNGRGGDQLCAVTADHEPGRCRDQDSTGKDECLVRWAVSHDQPFDPVRVAEAS